MLSNPRVGRYFRLWFSVSVFLIIWTTIADAQQEGWTPPLNVSNSQNPSQAPVVAVDQSGRVHVMWGENDSEDSTKGLDTAFYTVLLSDDTWSTPWDIIAVPPGDSLYPSTLEIDTFGNLIFVATHSRGLSINMAPAENAASARSWTTERLETESRINSADLAIDNIGAYHLVYIRNDREVVYTNSVDNGRTWSAPVTVASVDDNGRAVTGPTIAVDDDSGIYVTWTQTAEENNWSPVGVWFARSLSAGAQWDAPIEMINGAGYGSSAVIAMDPETVHVYWNGSIGLRGRYHRYSQDRGATWSETIIAMPTSIGGFAGRAHLLVDSGGTLHVLVAGLGYGRESIWHSIWTGTNWTEPRSISGDLPNSQGTFAALGQGHLINTVWNELEGGDVWYSRLDTGSPVVMLPTLSPAPTAVSAGSTTAPATVPLTSADADSSPAPAQNVIIDNVPPTSSGSTTSAVLFGVLPAALLVAVVVLLNARRRG